MTKSYSLGAAFCEMLSVSTAIKTNIEVSLHVDILDLNHFNCAILKLHLLVCFYLQLNIF